MTTISDTKEYTPSNLKSPVTIAGQAGKKIKIEAVSLQHASGKAGITETTTVLVNGTAYAEWKYASATYSDTMTYKRYPLLVDTGKDAVISWTIVSGNTKYPGKMKNVSVTYSYVTVETDTSTDTSTDTENGTIIIVEGLSSSDATTALASITAKLKDAGTKYDTIYIAKGV